MARRTIDWGRTIGGLLEKLYTEREEKYPLGLRPLEKAAGLYGPGYMAGQERLALTGAKEALGARGLGGTTRPQAVSAGMKTGFEDVRRAGLSEALARISGYIGGTAPTAGTLAHLATGGFGGALQERGMEFQTREAEQQRRERREATQREERARWKEEWSIGGGGGGGYSVPSSAYQVSPTGRIGGAVARAGGEGAGETTPWEPIQWTALEEGLPAGYAKTPTGAEYMGGESEVSGQSLIELAKKHGVYQVGYTPETLKYRLKQKGINI